MRAWQHFVDGAWLNSAPPSGGLKKLTDTAARGSVVVVDSIGPRGPQGEKGEPGPPGTSVRISEMLSVEYQDGVNTIFPLSNHADLSQAFQVFRNGLMELQGYGYLVTPTHITFTTPPLNSDVIAVVYQKAQ